MQRKRGSVTTEFRELEDILRQHEAKLTHQTAQRFHEVFKDEQHVAAYGLEGARFLHDLVIAAVALYPSETSIRESYRWAFNPAGLLARHHITYQHQLELLHAYFETVRQVSELSPVLRQALEAVEHKIFSVMAEVCGSSSETQQGP